MIAGLVEIAEAGRHLSVYRGFLKVTEDGKELGRIPLDDITALILSGPQVTLSKTLMVELAERKSVIVTCGKNFHPLSLTLPFAAHFESAGILEDQISASAPLKKRLWQRIVKAKIENQQAVLRFHAPEHPKIQELASLSLRVKSGDPQNMEAQAARHYWPALMGSGFRRERNGGGANVCLNYGYTVLRAAAARSVCAAGLHPALGVHHHSRVNAFALVDDLMEPFRPMVDSIARDIIDEAITDDLSPNTKRRLAAVLQEDMVAEEALSPVINCIGRLAQSTANSLGEKRDLLAVAEVRPADRLI